MIKKKKAVIDLLFCIAALGLMNGVLQLIVYPYINKSLGTETYGNILYVLGVLSIFTPAFGTAVNHNRLVERNKYKLTNGDANITLLILGIVGLVVSFCFVVFNYDSIHTLILWVPLFIFTFLRYYSDVEFRLIIDYKRYFFFYVILSSFYIIGLFAFHLSGVWTLSFLFGEIAAVLYVVFRGNIFHKPFQKSENFSRFFRSTLILSISYLISYLVLNADRLILSYFVGDTAVSVYYIASLIGKTIAILMSSFNSVIVGYLTKSKIGMDLKLFLKFIVLLIVLAFVFAALCVVGTPIFVRIFYPNLSETVQPIIFLASLAQIEFFLSSTLLVIILTFASQKWQLIVQVGYSIVFILSCSICAHSGGLISFSYAAMTINAVRLVIVCLIGIIQIKLSNNQMKREEST